MIGGGGAHGAGVTHGGGVTHGAGKSHGGGRAAYLDFLRILAAFLVIVNHTNSYVFKALTPADGAWTLSILWYYLSKTAVPLFVMVSGACLLGKTDDWRKAVWRFCRVLMALLAASYFYYLYDAWVYYGLWPRMADAGTFFSKVWRNEITDGFWYLYFYLGMMLTLPFWQRMAATMGRKDYHYLLAVTLGLGAAWPLLSHYAPGLALPAYLDLSVPCVYVGLFFAGRYIGRYVRPNSRKAWGAGLALAAALGACLWLTYVEFGRVAPGASYWFMDDRSSPALLVAIAATAVMVLAKCAFQGRRERSGKVLRELGGCAFGIYLVQDWLVAQSKERLFEPLCGQMPMMAAVLCWELAIFALALGAAWVLRRIPGIKRIL